MGEADGAGAFGRRRHPPVQGALCYGGVEHGAVSSEGWHL